MCLLVLAYRTQTDCPLLLAANRDEFYDRPAAPAQFWPEAPRLLAGRDLLAGGTWLGVTRDGRFAAVTNYREARTVTPPPRSRGDLVRDYLLGDTSADRCARSLPAHAADYAGFNLLCGDRQSLWWYSNRGGPPRQLAPGIYGLTNDQLDTPWPKVQASKAALAGLCKDGAPPADALLELLQDRRTHPASADPAIGLDTTLAQALSAIFIDTPRYGTRCSTVLRISAEGRAEFVERRHAPERGESRFRFSLHESRTTHA